MNITKSAITAVIANQLMSHSHVDGFSPVDQYCTGSMCRYSASHGKPLLHHPESAKRRIDLDFEGLTLKEQQSKCRLIWCDYFGVTRYGNMRELQSQEAKQLGNQFAVLTKEQQIKLYVYQVILKDQSSYGDVSPTTYLSKESVVSIDHAITDALQRHKSTEVQAIANDVIEQLSD